MSLQLKKSEQSDHETPTVRVKISGDGARMSHSSSLFVCSFSLLDQGQQVLSSAGTFTIYSFSDNLDISEINWFKKVNGTTSAQL